LQQSAKLGHLELFPFTPGNRNKSTAFLAYDTDGVAVHFLYDFNRLVQETGGGDTLDSEADSEYSL